MQMQMHRGRAGVPTACGISCHHTECMVLPVAGQACGWLWADVPAIATLVNRVARQVYLRSDVTSGRLVAQSVDTPLAQRIRDPAMHGCTRCAGGSALFAEQ